MSAVSSAAPQTPPEFEVVSIKPYVSQSDPAAESSDTQVLPGGRFSSRNVGIMKLIRNSFLVEDSRVSGVPGWADSETYTIEAKTADGVEITPDNISKLMLSVLQSRFQLRFHRETREIPVYALEVMKGGSKLKPHTGDGKQSMSTNSRAGVVTVTDRKVSLPDFAGTLARQVGRPVIDKTGLAGEFDIELQWSPEQAVGAGPSVFTALQSLGLRLASTKGPAEFIVVDHIERPSAN
jgi:uncharacterized protein (TIGR03435 family)